MNFFKGTFIKPNPIASSSQRKMSLSLWLIVAKKALHGHIAPLKRIFVAFAVPPAI